jgi:hypothetical protein
MGGGGEKAGRRRRPSAAAEARQRTFRRRRRVALGATLCAVLVLTWAVSALFEGGDSDSATAEKAPPELPRGGRTILPRHRVVSYYGAPQDAQLGILGAVSPRAAARKLRARARQFERRRRPVLPAFELIATIARSAPGADGLYRQRQSDAVIRRYLRAARRMRGLLILDLQPGQADFVEEVRAFERYLIEPDVGLALDPEWSLPPGTAPGQEIGSTDAETINRISAYLSGLVRRRSLPQKILIVHQFTDGMVKERGRVVAPPGVAIVFNIDGFGSPELKSAIYRRLAKRGRGGSGRLRRFAGLKLFFEEDTTLMKPGAVLALRPRPDVVVYE